MNGRRNVGRVLGHVAVIAVILAVIAAAFAISYDPVRDIARNAGVQSWLVRIYPGILDAVFLVACACALLLRGARWWNRLYAWVSVLVTGALIGAADVYHATGLRLPRRTMDGTVWALPWALVLLGFSLWLTTLQRSKPSDRDAGETPAADAPVLALEGAPAARAALPAPGRNGGLAEVGFGEQAAGTAADARLDGAPADIEKGAADVEPRVAAEAEPAEVMAAENAAEPQPPAESTAPVVPAAAGDPARAEDTAETETAASAAETGEATAADEVAQAEPAEEPEWPFEAEEPAEASKAAAADRGAAPSDDATPPYGFPAVSEQDDHDQADRMPTLLSAPVPADMETAPAPAEEEDRGELPPPAPFERVRSTPTPPQK
jgi:hypothetical protein